MLNCHYNPIESINFNHRNRRGKPQNQVLLCTRIPYLYPTKVGHVEFNWILNGSSIHDKPPPPPK